jgi:Protein of unknown function (DUF3102)
MGEIQKLDTLAESINTEHRACEAAVASAVDHAVAAGEMLLEVKHSLKHGGWLKWLDANFEGSRRHAQRYMQLAEHKGQLNATRVSHSSITGALRELQGAKHAEEERRQRAERAEAASKPEAWSGGHWLPLEVMWHSPRSWLLSNSYEPSEYKKKELTQAIGQFTRVPEVPEEVLGVHGAEEALMLWREANERAAEILLEAIEAAEYEQLDAQLAILDVAKDAPNEKFPFGAQSPEHKQELLRTNEAQKRAWYAKHPDGVCRCHEARRE